MADPPALDLAFWDADASVTAAADVDVDADADADAPARLGPSMYVTLFEGAHTPPASRVHTA
jgi:hypothetical protein